MYASPGWEDECGEDGGGRGLARMADDCFMQVTRIGDSDRWIGDSDRCHQAAARSQKLRAVATRIEHPTRTWRPCAINALACKFAHAH